MEIFKHFLDILAQPMGMIGLLGQLMFSSRFLVQWITSEKKGKSTIPLAFWYLSIAGGLMVLTYGIWREDPIIVLGQSAGLIVYVRNLMLIHRRKTKPSDTE